MKQGNQSESQYNKKRIKDGLLSGSRPLCDDEAWDIGKQKGEQNWVTFLSKPFFPEWPS